MLRSYTSLLFIFALNSASELAGCAAFHNSKLFATWPNKSLLTVATLDAPASEDVTGEPRYQEISKIISRGILRPITRSVYKDGWDPEGIWKRTDPIKGRQTIGASVTNAIQELGPTYVKFGQALSSRPDIVPIGLAEEFAILQDDMNPFDTEDAKMIIREELQNLQVDSRGIDKILDSIGNEPVAAASIGQVYKGYVPQVGEVAIKVQRPGIKEVVARDAKLLRQLAKWVESLPGLPMGRTTLVAAKVSDAVDEFMQRLFEELDYRREVRNIEEFASLYSIRSGSSKTSKVVVPAVINSLCSRRVIVMEWIDGTKLADAHDQADVSENLQLVKECIECTLSQLLGKRRNPS